MGRDPGAGPVEDTDRFLGRCAWTEAQLYEVVGGLAATTAAAGAGAAAAAVYLDRVSQHHAAHSRAMAGCLTGDDPAALLAPPGGPAVELLSALAATGGDSSVAAMVHLVLPWLAESYRHHLKRWVRHGEARKALEQAAVDHEADAADGARTVAAAQAPAQLAALRRAHPGSLFSPVGNP